MAGPGQSRAHQSAQAACGLQLRPDRRRRQHRARDVATGAGEGNASQLATAGGGRHRPQHHKRGNALLDVRPAHERWDHGCDLVRHGGPRRAQQLTAAARRDGRVGGAGQAAMQDRQIVDDGREQLRDHLLQQQQDGHPPRRPRRVLHRRPLAPADRQRRQKHGDGNAQGAAARRPKHGDGNAQGAAEANLGLHDVTRDESDPAGQLRHAEQALLAYPRRSPYAGHPGAHRPHRLAHAARSFRGHPTRHARSCAANQGDAWRTLRARGMQGTIRTKDCRND